MTPRQVFHDGELQFQARAGTSGAARELGSFISDRIGVETGAGHLLQSQHMVAITSVDDKDHVWLSIAFGPPGFVSVPSSTELKINLAEAVQQNDMLLLNVAHSPNAPVAVLATDFERRTRYRTNGYVSSLEGDTLTATIAVDEAFPNCPKYIQRRTLTPMEGSKTPLSAAATATRATSLSSDDVRTVSEADTLFLGTHFAEGGADATHRGGEPGFVRVLSPTQIAWPDYRGNGMFQSGGNILANPEVGVTFLDFQTGDTLQLSGTAQISWEADVLDGAERVTILTIRQVVRTRGATNYRWTRPDYSPYNPALQCHLGQQQEHVSSNTQSRRSSIYPVTVTLAKIVAESPAVKTFRFLAPRTISFLPGQYATFQFHGITDEQSPIVRTWTLSETPNSIKGDNTLDISVKRKDGGFFSNWLHDRAELGLQAELLGIGGEMTPITVHDSVATTPSHLLLISGGIGMTPNLAIVRGLGAFGVEKNSKVTMIHQERHENELPFQEELTRRARTYPDFQYVNFITSGSSSHQSGRMTQPALEKLVEDPDKQTCYLCGPPGFMRSVASMLVELGVKSAAIHTENFDF